ncbi:uncharacterized protein LOC142487915 [Ascaphus truei]|uniref:uncharacterized protein LOC142487915 n=1 Tax=Ascaphus truei TaxID=8439 RepID=UPI003F5A1B3A
MDYLLFSVDTSSVTAAERIHLSSRYPPIASPQGELAAAAAALHLVVHLRHTINTKDLPRDLQIFHFAVTSGWHDLDNTEYDCWPLEKPDELNMIDCGGLEMAWVHRPPERANSGETFDVTYSVFASDEFYHYAVAHGILFHSDAASAKRFCEQQECPSNWKDTNGQNCCVHHANIHSCPLSFMGKGGICGPWIPDDGQIFTHTLSTAGKMTQGNWTAKVVLSHVGVTSLIAHIRVGKMQVALEAKTLVLPAVAIVFNNLVVKYRHTPH